MREQAVRVRQPAVGERELRVFHDRLLEEVQRLLEAFVGALVQVIAPLQVQVARRQVLRRPARAATLAGVHEPRLELVDDRLRHRFLRGEHVAERHVDRLGPEVRGARRVDEVDRDAEPIAGLADAAGQEHGDLPGVLVAEPQGQAAARLHREDAQRLELRQAVNDLLLQAVAEVGELLRRAVVRERLHGDRVLSGERRPERAARGAGRLAVLEDRRVAALGELDDQRVGAAFLAVVAHQARAQPPRLHPDDRVGARIERRVLVEDLDADHVFLELIAASRERFGHGEVQEPLEPVDLAERDARQHALELRPGGLVGVLRGRGAAARIGTTLIFAPRLDRGLIFERRPGMSRPACRLEAMDVAEDHAVGERAEQRDGGDVDQRADERAGRLEGRRR